MPKAKYDLNDNGKIDPDEREIMLEDRRRIMKTLMPSAMPNVEWHGLVYWYAFVSVWRSVYRVDGAT